MCTFDTSEKYCKSGDTHAVDNVYQTSCDKCNLACLVVVCRTLLMQYCVGKYQEKFLTLTIQNVVIANLSMAEILFSNLFLLVSRSLLLFLCCNNSSLYVLMYSICRNLQYQVKKYSVSENVLTFHCLNKFFPITRVYSSTTFFFSRKVRAIFGTKYRVSQSVQSNSALVRIYI